jgi:hypothetical protein
LPALKVKALAAGYFGGILKLPYYISKVLDFGFGGRTDDFSSTEVDADLAVIG